VPERYNASTLLYDNLARNPDKVDSSAAAASHYRELTSIAAAPAKA